MQVVGRRGAERHLALELLDLAGRSIAAGRLVEGRVERRAAVPRDRVAGDETIASMTSAPTTST